MDWKTEKYEKIKKNLFFSDFSIFFDFSVPFSILA